MWPKTHTLTPIDLWLQPVEDAEFLNLSYDDEDGNEWYANNHNYGVVND